MPARRAARFMIYDLGKSGSSGPSDAASASNPKYGTRESHLCSETISWYYHEHGVRLTSRTGKVYDFKDIHDHTQMYDRFLRAGRLYCYHSGADKWVLRHRNGHWVRSPAGTYVSYYPKPGDYLDRRNPGGHAMMLLRWRAGDGEADVMDGPAPVTLRVVPVRAHEQAGTKDYCIGRI